MSPGPGRQPAGPLRLLMLGTANSPHVEALSIAMHARGFDVVVGGDQPAELAESAIPPQIPVFNAPELARHAPRGILAHVRWIRGLVDRLRPDVVHANWLPGYAFCAALARASPLVAMAWGSDVYRAGRLQQLANRVAVRRADLVMADSADLLERLYDLGAARRKGVLVNWGVDLNAFAPAPSRAAIKRELGLGSGPLILSPRSLMRIYNIDVIVDAFREIAQTRPQAQLVVKHMGAKSMPPSIPEDERIRVIGRVPYEQMAAYYRAADVCVSIASSDSSPRSVWEAMACGAPCVLSDLPWVHETIEPGSDALVVPIEARRVRTAIERILDDEELAQTLQSRGRALVERTRDQDVEMGRLADVYRELAGAGRVEGHRG